MTPITGTRRGRVNLEGLATLTLFLLLWEAAIRTGLLTFEYIPPPSRVVTGLREITVSGELLTNVLHTVSVAVLGWGAAAIVGVTVGCLVGSSWTAWKYSAASLETLRALPIVAFVPVSVLLFGFTSRMEIVIAFYGAMWPILLNTASGVRSVNRNLVEVGRVLGLSPVTQIWKLRLPAATASVVVGLRLGLATAFVLTLVAEMIGNPAGIGFALITKGQALRSEQVFAYMVVIGLLGVVLNWLLVRGAKVLFKGQMAAAREVD